MSEHRIASFVAKVAWLAFIGMQVGVFAGLRPEGQGILALIVVGAIAVVASSICVELPQRRGSHE